MGAGFHLVDVSRLGPFLLIAFTWYETGDEIYARVFDLRGHDYKRISPEWAETILTTNLLEDLGRGWCHARATLQRIGGLTFILPRQSQRAAT